METKHQLKPRLSSSLYLDLDYTASRFTQAFYKEVIPLLELFGFGSDERINKFLKSVSTEEIFLTAISENEQRVAFLSDLYKARGEDIWAGFREDGCLVKSPFEDGFVFKAIPYSQAMHRQKWLKAISAKNGSLHIDDKILRQESFVYPSPRRQECYAGVAAFCDWLREKNFKVKDEKLLFIYDEHGKLIPNEKYIMFCGTTLD